MKVNSGRIFFLVMSSTCPSIKERQKNGTAQPWQKLKKLITSIVHLHLFSPPHLTVFVYTSFIHLCGAPLDNVNRKVYNTQYNMGTYTFRSSWFAYSAAYATGLNRTLEVFGII